MQPKIQYRELSRPDKPLSSASLNSSAEASNIGKRNCSSTALASSQKHHITGDMSAIFDNVLQRCRLNGKDTARENSNTSKQNGEFDEDDYLVDLQSVSLPNGIDERTSRPGNCCQFRPRQTESTHHLSSSSNTHPASSTSNSQNTTTKLKANRNHRRKNSKVDDYNDEYNVAGFTTSMEFTNSSVSSRQDDDNDWEATDGDMVSNVLPNGGLDLSALSRSNPDDKTRAGAKKRSSTAISKPSRKKREFLPIDDDSDSIGMVDVDLCQIEFEDGFDRFLNDAENDFAADLQITDAAVERCGLPSMKSIRLVEVLDRTLPSAKSTKVQAKKQRLPRLSQAGKKLAKAEMTQAIKSMSVDAKATLIDMEKLELRYGNMTDNAEMKVVADFKALRNAVIARESTLLTELRRVKEHGLKTIRKQKSTSHDLLKRFEKIDILDVGKFIILENAYQTFADTREYIGSNLRPYDFDCKKLEQDILTAASVQSIDGVIRT